MQTEILWTGREYYSLEHCLVNESATGATIDSTITGSYREMIYKVEYEIRTNKKWETIYLNIHSRHDDQEQFIRLENNSTGKWLYNGNTDERFNGCIDVDIPLTPFTNTLPIRRLSLQKNESKEIDVIYCDLLATDIRPVRQRYTSISGTAYHYQNVPNDFEAVIQVDKLGLVVDYPGLFTRSACKTR